MGLPGQKGSEYQAYVELVRVSKTTGAWERITSFDSNLQCAGGPSLCQADNTIKNFTVASAIRSTSTTTRWSGNWPHKSGCDLSSIP